ncbi:hypothetical protein QYE76_062711 [Lolium multiflorum]|uniref:Adenylosuccinate synthetase n=1 Tax=Lolium multiflorum TaxID=4521 RepID=A0AAD8S4S8_LOLMU|nr:hypothetical protein QYE76_062711 [Lolium multiflorum]
MATFVSAVAEESSTAAAARGRLESLSQVAGVLGTQWGDEGKGKLVDILAQRFDVIARCQVFLSLARACALCCSMRGFGWVRVWGRGLASRKGDGGVVGGGDDLLVEGGFVVI